MEHSNPDLPPVPPEETSRDFGAPGVLARQITVLPDGTTPVPLGSGTIVSVLGEGGAAVVYEIWVDKLGVSRAVKVLKPNASPESTGRFETEMRITAQLRHPNIIEIHGVGDWHGLPYIEMEKIDGLSLDKVLRERGRLPPQICTSIAIIACRALRFTHSHAYLVNGKEFRGILHRDLKPGNIMISRIGLVKLMDFGIATPTGISMHTMDGSVVGSMQYIAPELLEGSSRADARSDIFSFGCVLYEMITGHRAFPEKNMAKLVTARMKNLYRPLAEFNVSCPRSLVRLVNFCLAQNPDKRAPSAEIILKRLEKIHAKISKSNPEDLVEYYINSSLRKRAADIRRPVGPVVVAAGVLIAATGVLACLHFVPRVSRIVIRPLTGLRIMHVLRRHHAPDNRGRAETAAPDYRAGEQPISPADLLLPARPPARTDSAPEGDVRSESVANRLTSPSQGRLRMASLERKYRTKDMVEILGREADKGDFVAVLTLFDALDEESAATVRARIIKLRALEALGNREALDAFFLRPDIPDKEYYLSKAQYLASQKRYVEAIDLCEMSRQSPACIGSADSLDRLASYIRASCLTNLCIGSPDPQARQRAIDGWNDVKNLLGDDRDHPYYALAEKNIQLLSDQPAKAPAPHE